jgi:hypothetical protein
MTIWDVAGTPEGGVVLSAVAEYGPPKVKPVPVKSFLLTYSRDGRLTRLWDVYPYEHHHVAVDDSGNVFGLGTKDTASASYPLLVKYSPDGNVLGKFLPAQMFSLGDTVVGSGSANGETEMFVYGEGVFIWLGPSQEVLRLSTSGNMLSRNSLDKGLSLLAEQRESRKAKVVGIAETNGKVIAQVQLFPKKKDEKATLAMMAFANDGSEASSIPVGPIRPARFLGATREGKMVFFEEVQPGQLVVTQY